MTVYLTNAFSINMLLGDTRAEFVQIQPETAAEIVSGVVGTDYFVNAIGHKETDTLVRNQLSEWLGAGAVPEGQRANVYATSEMVHVVAQYRGPRLPEGATSLPEGAEMEYWKVMFEHIA